jgi:glyceraldehyde 3-phosphate dehydrogenase
MVRMQDMPVRVGINGFGRTGRATFRSADERGAAIEWAGINDVMDIEMLAHLLRHDSVYGPFPGSVEVVDGALRVDGARSPCSPRPTRPRCRGARSVPRS